MLKAALSFAALLVLAACSTEPKEEIIMEPQYNYLVDNMVVIEQSSRHVIYEYRDVRIDEVAPVAAVYCLNQGNKQATLYNITLRPDNRRRATFVCE